MIIIRSYSPHIQDYKPANYALFIRLLQPQDLTPQGFHTIENPAHPQPHPRRKMRGWGLKKDSGVEVGGEPPTSTPDPLI
jgi:hypothetical protein